MIGLFAIIGLLIGGVLNVLADVLPSKQRFQAPFCTHCNTRKAAIAWLATTGYVLRKEHCTNCGIPIPRRNLLVELTTAVTFAFVYYGYGPSGYTLLLSIYMAILILVTVIDLEHRLVLNKVILPAILLALLAAPFTPDLSWKQAVVGGLVGFVIFYLIAIIYPGGMGAGDVKLAAFIGLITGFPDVFVAIVVTIFAGGLISLLLVLTRIRSMRDYIPYGPFLVIGGVFALFWGQPLMTAYLDQDAEAHVTSSIVTQASHRDMLWRVDSSSFVVNTGGGSSPLYAMNKHQPSAYQSASTSSSQPSSRLSSDAISRIKNHSLSASSATSAISGSGSFVSSSKRSKPPSHPV
jgi:leader peptidase (prepilin peptidase)/N-methyltransferase